MTTGVAAIVAWGPAFASDLPTYKAPPAPVFTWTGFYVGVNGGYGWNGSSVSYAPNDSNALFNTCGGSPGGTCIPPASFNVGGGLAGGQIGYNYQLDSNWLVGVEADYDWSGARGTGNSNFSLNSVGPLTFVAKESIGSFGTLRGRLGFVPMSPLLIYATGGLAYGAVSEHASTPPLPGPPGLGGYFSGGHGYYCYAGTGVSCFTGSSSKTNVGWTLGAGGEYAITNNITFRVEYLYVNLGRPNGLDSVATASGGSAPSSFTANFAAASLNVVRAGLNWKF
ncbi:MAG: outer membrane beta-barrel protein [Roseiarcus sp.]